MTVFVNIKKHFAIYRPITKVCLNPHEAVLISGISYHAENFCIFRE